MALILSIETSEKICSVALSEFSMLLGSRETEVEKSHASQLTVLIEELFKTSDKRMDTLNAVAISKGPGSYTGLRIGVSVAKGICYGLSIPLISINTLQFLRKGLSKNSVFNQLVQETNQYFLCPMIDARRMEVYSALQNQYGEFVEETKAEEINYDSYKNYLEQSRIIFFGSGADKCRKIIQHENAIFIEGIRPLATHMIDVALENYNQKKFENLAYFEPFYLKDFVATTSKKNVFNM